MSLVDLLRPSLIVELGTYKGVSLCAFCQALKELRIEGRCCAIDTWEGDPQSGYFDGAVLEELRAYHDPLYGSFSQLIQSTFDDAVSRFPCGAIDLLHIDGYHTFESVKHDFELWLPKMSEHGVVLLHDTRVRERDFGVWRLWEELAPRYPHFEFEHAYGLGVLGVGTSLPESLSALLLTSPGERARVQAFFAQLGTRLERIQQSELKASELEAQLGRAGAELEQLRQELAGLRTPVQATELGYPGRQARESPAACRSGESRNGASPTCARTSIAVDRENARGGAEGRLVIGVVTYNNSPGQLSALGQSIDLAREHLDSSVALEVFMTDNGAPTALPDCRTPMSKFESCGNIGFARAMNRLMSRAFAEPGTQWFLCVNPDGILHRNCLGELIRQSQSYPGSLIEARQFPEEHCKAYDPETLETPWASGACLLVPRELFLALGGFDPNFFLYLEDVDLSWTAKAAGFQVRVAVGALFAHAVLDRAPDEQTDRLFLLSGRYLARKWGNHKFLLWTEKELVGRGYYASKAKLPPVPTPEHLPADVSVADFSRHFHFAANRW